MAACRLDNSRPCGPWFGRPLLALHINQFFCGEREQVPLSGGGRDPAPEPLFPESVVSEGLKRTSPVPILGQPKRWTLGQGFEAPVLISGRTTGRGFCPGCQNRT